MEFIGIKPDVFPLHFNYIKQIDAFETVLHFKFNNRLSKLWRIEGCQNDQEKLLTNEFLNSSKSPNYTKSLTPQIPSATNKPPGIKSLKFSTQVSVISLATPLSDTFASYVSSMRHGISSHHRGTRACVYVSLCVVENKAKLVARKSRMAAGVKDVVFGDRQEYDRGESMPDDVVRGEGSCEGFTKNAGNLNHIHVKNKIHSEKKCGSDDESSVVDEKGNLPQWLIDATDVLTPEIPKHAKLTRSRVHDLGNLISKGRGKHTPNHFRVLSHLNTPECTPRGQYRNSRLGHDAMQIHKVNIESEKYSNKITSLTPKNTDAKESFRKMVKSDIFSRTTIVIRQSCEIDKNKLFQSSDYARQKPYHIATKSQNNSKSRLTSRSREHAPTKNNSDQKIDVSNRGINLTKSGTAKTSREFKEKRYGLSLPIEDTIHKPRISLFKNSTNGSTAYPQTQKTKTSISTIVAKIRSIEESPIHPKPSENKFIKSPVNTYHFMRPK